MVCAISIILSSVLEHFTEHANFWGCGNSLQYTKHNNTLSLMQNVEALYKFVVNLNKWSVLLK